MRRYKVGGREIELEIDDQHVAVRFDRLSSNADRSVIARSASFSDEASLVDTPQEQYHVLKVSKDNTESYQASAQKLIENDKVEQVSPVYTYGDKQLITPNRLLVGTKAGCSGALEQYGMELIEEFADDEFLVRVSDAVDPIDLLEKIEGDENFEYAEPDFVVIGKHIAKRRDEETMALRKDIGSSFVPNFSRLNQSDPLLKYQYAIFITNSDKAWNETVGDPSVKIAILDEGVDLRHPDLGQSIVGSFDVTDSVHQQPNPWDAHGTACAGLAAATHNGKGIMGVAGGCSLLAIRIAYSQMPRGKWITSHRWITQAIDWAWKSGADILSNSWGGGPYSQSITNAFDRARTRGRNGLGAVNIVAAGNDSGPVDFPGLLPDVMTVSASNEYDEFKTKQSRDGEDWWGSNYGPEVDIAAPGVHNLTTDVTGRGGYELSDYTDFNGTSSATPIVAGAAGLVISKNHAVTEKEVRRVLINSADKVGNEPYDRNGRNDQMGYGRVNVYKALKAV